MNPSMTYREALREALRDALQKDSRVFLMGEDVGRYGGSYAVSKGLLEAFGPERIRDTPLSELGFVGAGIGAALGGMRPIVEIMTVNFSLLALDPLMNTAAALRHMSGGQFSVPLVVRMATGAGRQLAAQHSHSLEGWYAHIPGLKILAPATVEDARGMLWPALQDPDPVLIFEHAQLYNLEGDPGDWQHVDIGSAKVRRTGKDLTLIAYGGTLGKALRAAEQLAGRALIARSSTCACCVLWMTPPSCPQLARPIAHWLSMRAGAVAAWLPKSLHGSSNRLFSSWMRHPQGCAVPRYPFPMPGTSKKPRCHKSRQSSPPPMNCVEGREHA